MSHILGVVLHRGAPPDPDLLASMERPLPDTQQRDAFIEGPAALCWRSRPDAPRQGLWVGDDLVVAIVGYVLPEEDSPVQPEAPHRAAEVVAKAWRRWGIDLVERLRGDFAAAIYERKTGNLHLFRDRTGLYRIFWARDERRIAFSTDPRCLLSLPWVSRELERTHIAEYLSFRVVHAPRTLLRDVFQLESGHRLRFSPMAVRVQQYFRPTYAAPDTPLPREADIVEELHNTVERAVRRRLVETERVGVYLSGGVGSTAIAAAARAASRRLETYTVTFAEEAYPEVPFAGRVARLLGMEHHTVTVSSLDIAESFEDAVQQLGHPVGNASLVLQACLARAAARNVDLVLTGDGADQLFGGRMLRKPAEALRSSLAFQRLPLPVRTLAGSLLRRSRRYRQLTVPADRYALENGIGGIKLFDARMRRSLLVNETLVRPNVRREVLTPFYDEVETDTYNAVLHAFFRSQLVSDILPRVTTTAEAHGLDVGFPLLDPDVQRLAQVLPGSFKLRAMEGSFPTRWLLRSMLRGALPPALINRPDRGLPHPLDDWLAGPGRLFTESRFQALREDPLHLWHHTGLEAVKRGVGRRPGASHRMWSLFILDAWARHVGAH